MQGFGGSTGELTFEFQNLLIPDSYSAKPLSIIFEGTSGKKE